MSESTETLRRAAALMRERAESAEKTHPGQWRPMGAGSVVFPMTKRMSGTVAETYPKGGSEQQIVTTEHIASWHPAVALAVADSLDTAGADLWAHGPLCCEDGCMECDDNLWAPHVRRALAVARAYLGADADPNITARVGSAWTNKKKVAQSCRTGPPEQLTEGQCGRTFSRLQEGTDVRRFKLIRDDDVSGVSGTGHVADGVQFPDGMVATRWRSTVAQTCVWDSIEDVEKVHGHGGATRVVWLD